MFRNPTTDLLVLLVIVLLIFGPKRLPSLGRQLGHGLREFKDSITGESREGAGEPRQLPEPGASAPPSDAAAGASPPEAGTHTPTGRESGEVGSPEQPFR